MIIEILRVFAILCIAIILGKLVAKIKLPAILGWLLAGIIFGPYLVEIVTPSIMDSLWYQIMIKFFECFAGIMIGKELIFKKIAKSGKQIIGITFIQSIATFLFVSAIFAIVFAISKIPIYLAFIFGGIALATAPAPALSIVNEYKTNGPVTKTLIPLAIIDDVIGVVIFFTTISIIQATKGTASVSALSILGMIVLPFVIGIAFGLLATFILKKVKNSLIQFILFVVGLLFCVITGLLTDHFLFHSFSLNYLLIGMAYSGTLVNFISEEQIQSIMDRYNPLLYLSFIIVIVNLGMPLDYRLITGAGLFTLIYILSRAIGKIGGAYLGGKWTKADPKVTKYLGFTLLPHSGVSLVFTGIAVNTMTLIDPSLATIISGTIVSAAIINEIIAVIIAKIAFKKAGEINQESIKK